MTTWGERSKFWARINPLTLLYASCHQNGALCAYSTTFCGVILRCLGRSRDVLLEETPSAFSCYRSSSSKELIQRTEGYWSSMMASKNTFLFSWANTRELLSTWRLLASCCCFVFVCRRQYQSVIQCITIEGLNRLFPCLNPLYFDLFKTMR